MPGMIDKVRKLSNGQKLTEIGAKAGISPVSVYRWDKREPRLTNVAKVANVLGVDYRLLLPDQEELLKQAAEQEARRKAKKAQQSEK